MGRSFNIIPLAPVRRLLAAARRRLVRGEARPKVVGQRRLVGHARELDGLTR